MGKTIPILSIIALCACTPASSVSGARALPDAATDLAPSASVFAPDKAFPSPERRRDFLARVARRDDILDIIARPGTSQPWYRFARNNASAALIRASVDFYRRNRDIIDDIAARYGVPAEIIVAVLGIETRYGGNTGSFRTADALYTLALDHPKPQRRDYFRRELEQLLLMSDELGRDPFSFTGSYAGAMGLPQFMPSSYRNLARDGDGDGFADIWHNNADACASIAAYLVAHGWRSGAEVSLPVRIPSSPQTEALLEETTALKHDAGELRRMGADIPASISDDEKVILYRLQSTADRFEYHVGLHNFYVLWQYNHSRMYVHAVARIARGVRSGIDRS